MRILIIDQCSGSKDVPENAPIFDAENTDEYGREGLLARDDVPAIPAHKLYTGRQQGYVDSAVDRLRANGDTVDRVYISAGFGLVSERTELPPYEVTFNDMVAASIDERAASLGIPTAVQDLVQGHPPYDVVFFALGKDYYRACDIDATIEALPEETLGVVFNREALAEGRSNVVSLPARTAEAKEHGTIVVALKGRYIEYFADHRATGASVDGASDLVEYCTTAATTQTGLGEYD
jgi:hypothetical protein